MSLQEKTLAQDIWEKIENDIATLPIKSQLWLLEQLAQHIHQQNEGVRDDVTRSLERSLKENAKIWEQLS